MRIPSLLAVTALFTGCAATDSDFELASFDDCDKLAKHMANMAREEVQFRHSRGVGIAVTSQDFALGDSANEAGGGVAPPVAPGAAGEVSGTNTQEAGIDEADLVKTDGEHLYMISGRKLVVTRAWPLELAEQLATVDLDGAPQGMYLVDDLVVVLSRIQWNPSVPRSGNGWIDGQTVPTTVVTVIDVADPANPVVTRELYTRGELKESRRLGPKLYFVTYQDVRLDLGATTKRDARIAIDTALPDEWLPRRLDHVLVDGDWKTVEEPACACEDTWAAGLEGGTYTTTVQVLDITDPTGDIAGSSVVGVSDIVYASSDALYVAYSSWDDGPFGGWSSQDTTVVHKFDLTEGKPAYRASGKVPGQLPDQFGLSEWDGVLRVATTNWSDGNDGPTSGVYTLQENQGELVELGSLEGLAPGENLTAARFVGDMGYLVTYEVQWGDPLFTIDMSNPNNPAYGGELHIPGFSSYLHPMDDDHLLAVGMTDETGQWALQASIFDVSDITAPTRTHQEILPASGSEANDEHHAFNYFAPTETLTIPSWRNSGDTVLEVLTARPDELSSRGRVTQPADMIDQNDAWCGGVRRSVVMDGHVWAVGMAGMTAAHLDTPAERLQSVAFQGVDPCEAHSYEGWW